ncbi:MAG: hypothetical protein KBT11_00455 [Treponema sp.]|nr:hypothetical protein [Candidatus Treponema equifaecale]
MCKVNVLEAKTNFSKLLLLLEKKQESEVIVCRSGKPVAKITLIEDDVSRRIGGAKGHFVCPDDIDEYNDEIAKLFGMV